MLQTQAKYTEYLAKLDELVKKADLDKPKEALIKGIKERELLVPVVGGFSAGKSSAINAFLGENVLSVKITPETAIPTELRYSQDAYIEAIKENGTSERFGLNELNAIKERSGEFKFVRLFLNNAKLKSIEPLILVDMPGFDAPVEIHNKAILNYLERGIYFIFLEAAERGTISSSMRSHIERVLTLHRGFSFAISKCDMQPENEIKNIQSGIAMQIQSDFGYNKAINLLGKNKNNAAVMGEILAQIEPEKLIEDIYLDILQMDFNDTKSSLNTKISGLEANKNEAQEALNKLDRSLATISDTSTKIAQSDSTQISGFVAGTLNAVISNIRDCGESLAKTALNNPNAISQQINEIIQGVLLSEFAKYGAKAKDDIIREFKIALSDLNLQSFQLDQMWLNKLADGISTALDKISLGVSDNDSFMNSLSVAAPAIAQALAKIIQIPIVKIVLNAVAMVIGPLLSLFSSKKTLSADDLLGQILPSIRSKLEPELKSAYTEQVNGLRESISKVLEAKFKEKQEEIKAAQEEQSKKAGALETEIATLKGIATQMDDLKNAYLYAKNKERTENE